MNIRSLAALMIAGWVLAGSTVLAAEAQKTSGFPMADFKSTTYTFPPVVDGVVIVHEFVLTNRGTADLIIDKVKTG